LELLRLNDLASIAEIARESFKLARAPGLAAAAEAMIESHISGRLRVPHDPLANALVRCYADQPETLLPHLRRSSGESRELLARVTSEMATPAMADEMLHLTEDVEPEVRACAARGRAVHRGRSCRRC
jgi:hypothetical protein